jgi:putative DNA primase/helicase
MITANEPIQTTDPTSGLARRRLTIPFDKPFKGTSAEQRILIDMNDKGKPYGDFASLLPGLVNWLLDMSEVEMREYLMETTTKVPFFAKHNKEQILKSNSLLDWMEHCVVFDVDAICQIDRRTCTARNQYSIC